MSGEYLYQIIRETNQKLVDYQEKMNHFEKDPMLLIKSIFCQNEWLLPTIIHRYGDEALLTIQSYWYQHLIPALRSHIGVAELRIDYDKTIFPSPIEMYIGEELVASLQIYDRVFVRHESREVQEFREEEKNIQTQIASLTEEMKKQEVAMKNPLVLGGANILKLADIAVRNKKYKQEVMEEIQELQLDILDLKKQLAHIQVTLKNQSGLNVERDYLVDRVERRIRQLPGYQSPETIEEGEFINEVEEREVIENE